MNCFYSSFGVRVGQNGKCVQKVRGGGRHSDLFQTHFYSLAILNEGGGAPKIDEGNSQKINQKSIL